MVLRVVGIVAAAAVEVNAELTGIQKRPPRAREKITFSQHNRSPHYTGI